jgi:hypothetical protein
VSAAIREPPSAALLAALRALRRWALGLGAVGVVATLVGLLLNRGQFFPAYLVAYLLWLGVAVGCLGMALIYRLTGGFWGSASREVVFAGAETVPLLALLFLPIAVGLPEIYVWARPGALSAASLSGHQPTYLAQPFFFARVILYFLSWVALATFLVRWTDQWEQTGEPRQYWRARRLAAGGLVAISLTIAFAMIDWVMSLDPTWTSTIFPAMVSIGHLLASFAFVVGVVCWLGDRFLTDRAAKTHLLNDLAGLTLAIVLLWSYLAFSQLLLIWAGNLNDEITFYESRLTNGWQWVGLAIIGSQFAVPFAALISTDVRRSARAMAIVAASLAIGRLIDLTWLVEPSFPPAPLSAYWLNLAAVIGLGGIWLALFADRLRRRAERAHHA